MTTAVSLKRPLAFAFAYLFAFVAGVVLCAVAAYWIDQARIMAVQHGTLIWNRVLSSITVTEYRYRDTAEISLDAAIELVSSEFKLPDSVILRALIDQESSGGNALYRFEESVYVRRSAADSKLYSVDERRMLASSHGVAHVMGYRAEPDCKIHWSRLYSPMEGLRCAARIMKANLAASTAKDPATRLREAFRRYNGSGPNAEYYADQMMARVGQLLFKRIGGSNER